VQSKVKNQQKTTGIEEKLDKISQLENGEQIDDKSCTVKFTYISVHTSCDNADRITDSPKSGTAVFV
jgi:hypothetical protein